MRAWVIPPGGRGWEIRRGLLAEIASGVASPPYDYRDVLYLVPNSHAAVALRRLFMEELRAAHGVTGCMPPRFETMSGFISRASMASSGLPVADTLTRRLVIDGLCKAEAARIKGHRFRPEALGGSVSAKLADRLGEAEASGVFDRMDGAEPGRPLAELIVNVGNSYRGWLTRHGLSDPFALQSSFSPGPELFSPYRSVVLDGFYDARPPELRLMRALAGHPDCVFMTEAAGLSSPHACEDGSPYAPTLELLSALGVEEILYKTSPRDEESGSAVIGALFAARPITETSAAAERLKPFGGTVTVVRAPDEESELHFIASGIKRSYIEGGLGRLSDAAVFIPSPEGYMQALDRVFSDAGIPYRSHPGGPITENPAVRDALGLLTLPVTGHHFAGVRAALSSMFFTFRPQPRPLGLITGHARDEGVTGGRENFLRLAEGLASIGTETDEPEHYAEAAESLRRLLVVTEPVGADPRTVRDWVDAARGLLSGSGIPERVAECSGEMPDTGRAYEAFAALLDGIGAASGRLGARVPYADFLGTLREHAAETRLTPEEDGTDAVRVVGRLRINTQPNEVIYAAGMVEKSMPASPGPDPLLSERTLEHLGLAGRKALNERDGRAAMSMLLSGARVFLTYPETFRSKPVSPSPYIRALEPFMSCSDITRTEYSRPNTAKPAIGPADAVRSAVSGSCALEPGAVKVSLGLLPDSAPGVARALRSLSTVTPDEGPPGHTPARFSVTELEGYLFCGWKYYQTRVLGLGIVADPEEDAAPHIAGSIVHRIFQRYHESGLGPVTHADMQAAIDALESIAREEFERLPATLRNIELKKGFIRDTIPGFLESEAGHAASGFRTLKAEHPLRAEVADGIVITGKLDRLDVTADGRFEVVDYKTGNYPKKESELFQLPLYAAMVCRDERLAAEAGAGLRPAGLVYYNLRGGCSRDVVLYEAPEPKPRKRQVADMSAFAESALERARAAVESIRNGVFEPDCMDDNYCMNRCGFLSVCRKGGVP